MKKVHKSSGTDDKKLQTSLKKMNVQPIHAIEEVNMFKEDGNVIHFTAPKGTLLQAQTHSRPYSPPALEHWSYVELEANPIPPNCLNSAGLGLVQHICDLR